MTPECAERRRDLDSCWSLRGRVTIAIHHLERERALVAAVAVVLCSRRATRLLFRGLSDPSCGRCGHDMRGHVWVESARLGWETAMPQHCARLKAVLTPHFFFSAFHLL